MPRATLDPAGLHDSFAYAPFTLYGWSFQYHLAAINLTLVAVRTPRCSHRGLGSSAFARRYLRNRYYFLFLRLLRCFSSPGSLACLCIQHTVTGCASRVPPFGDPRIIAHVQLPAAFRSLSRPSSALSAKASALRPFLLNLCRSGPDASGPFLWFSVRVHGESMHAPCFGLFLSLFRSFDLAC